MRIQQLPESPMLHGHVIPRNHTEGTNACRPKRRVQLGWAHIKFPFWCCFSSTTDREVHRGEPPGPVGLGTLGTCGMMGKGRIPHEVWEKTPNQPMKQNPKGNNQTSPKAISRAAQKVAEVLGRRMTPIGVTLTAFPAVPGVTSWPGFEGSPI